MDAVNTMQVSDNNGLLGQYGYSGDGLRVGKTTAAGSGAFIYDGDRVLQETTRTESPRPPTRARPAASIRRWWGS